MFETQKEALARRGNRLIPRGPMLAVSSDLPPKQDVIYLSIDLATENKTFYANKREWLRSPSESYKAAIFYSNPYDLAQALNNELKGWQ